MHQNTLPHKEIDKCFHGSTRIIAVTSGKGGVGKTNVSLNLAIALSKINKRVCIFDADLGLANINILLGIEPEFDIQHVISGEKEIADIVFTAMEGVQIIPGSSGIQELTNIENHQLEKLISSFSKLTLGLDYFIIDTSAGISSNVLSFVMAANDSIVIVTREPTSLTDGYSLIKVISKLGHKKTINILVNMVSSSDLAKKIFQKMFDASKKHLNIELNYLGAILTDKYLTEAVWQQKPVMTLYPHSSSSKNFARLAKFISSQPTNETESKETISSFWIRALKILRMPLKISKKPVATAKTPPPVEQKIAPQSETKPQPETKPQSETEPQPENIIQEKGEPVKRIKDVGKNGAQGVISKISDMIASNQFSPKDFVDFDEAEKPYIEKLDLFLNNYYRFLEMSFIAGKGKYFIELDFGKHLNERIEKPTLHIEDLANPFINSTTNVMKKMADMDIVTRKTSLKESLVYGDVTGIAKLFGHSEIVFSVAFPKECILNIISNLFGEDLSFLAEDGSLNPGIKDGVGEITNVITGEARRELFEKGFELQTTIPEVVDNRNYELANKVKPPFLIIPFLTNRGIISLSLGLIKSEE